jgi:predicted transcriptional regulator
MIAQGSYYTVQAWMVNDLGLQDKELLVYAIIYGFSQDGTSVYSGSARYLAEWIGCSRPTVMKVLKSLTEKKLLIKRDVNQNGVVFCTYRAVQGCKDSLQGVKNLDTPCKDSLSEGVKNLDTPCKDSLQNKDRYINTDNYMGKYMRDADASPAPSEEKKENEKPVKHKHGEYNNVLLTDEEVAKLQKQFPYDLQARIERLSEYIASTGKKYKSHYATIRAWANKDKAQQPARHAGRGYGAPAANIGPNGIPLAATKNDDDIKAIFG